MCDRLRWRTAWGRTGRARNRTPSLTAARPTSTWPTWAPNPASMDCRPVSLPDFLPAVCVLPSVYLCSCCLCTPVCLPLFLLSVYSRLSTFVPAVYVFPSVYLCSCCLCTPVCLPDFVHAVCVLPSVCLALFTLSVYSRLSAWPCSQCVSVFVLFMCLISVLFFVLD